jgi:large subunit ribosomal protein L25
MPLRLVAETGRTTGTRPSGRLRREGTVPGVVYGLGSAPVAVAVEWPSLRKVLTSEAGLNTLIDLEVDGSVNLSIVKDLQRHPVRRDVVHVDFLRLDPDAEIAVDVPVHLTGEATKAAKQHGLVEHTMHTLRIHVRPYDIPDSLTADISELEVGTTVTVADIALPSGVRTDVDAEEVVATAYVPRRVAALMAQDGGTGEPGDGEAAGEGGEGAAEASAADAADEAADADEAGDGEG